MVVEFELRPAGPSSQLAALYGLMFHVSMGTRSYTADEIRGWLANAGLRRLRVRRPPSLAGSVVVSGVR